MFPTESHSVHLQSTDTQQIFLTRIEFSERLDGAVGSYYLTNCDPMVEFC